jgi:hypothetical protein
LASLDETRAGSTSSPRALRIVMAEDDTGHSQAKDSYPTSVGQNSQLSQFNEVEMKAIVAKDRAAGIAG